MRCDDVLAEPVRQRTLFRRPIPDPACPRRPISIAYGRIPGRLRHLANARGR